MVRGQASPEFLVALMLYLGATLFIIMTVTQTYFLTSGEYRGGLLELGSEKVGRYLSADKGEAGWVENPVAAYSIGTNNLDAESLTVISGLSYPELKRLLKTSSDFRIEVTYLPSHVLIVDQSKQYLTGWVNMTLTVYNATGAVTNPSDVTGALIGPESVLATVTPVGDGYNLGFYVATSGTYRLNVATIDGNAYGSYHDKLEVMSS